LWGAPSIRCAIPSGRIAAYFFGALALWGVGSLISTSSVVIDMVARTPLLILYIAAIVKFEQYSSAGSPLILWIYEYRHSLHFRRQGWCRHSNRPLG